MDKQFTAKEIQEFRLWAQKRGLRFGSMVEFLGAMEQYFSEE